MTSTHPALKEAKLRVFCSEARPELFDAIVYPRSVFRHDPFDITEIHGEARDRLDYLLRRMTAKESPDAGSILLLRGNSGSGKTHLMRAFRSQVVRQRRGYFAYMQMSTMFESYVRYMLVNLINSLEQPYDEASSQETALMRLSNRLVDDPQVISAEDALALRENWEPDLVSRIAITIKNHPKFVAHGLDIQFLQALLCLQAGNSVINWVIGAILRCEPVPRAYLTDFRGILEPQIGDMAALNNIAHLGKLMWAIDGAPLVICADQLENIYASGATVQSRFSETVKVIIELAAKVPNTITVIACLSDFYSELAPHLTQSDRARIEKEVEPITLKGVPSRAELREILGRRLEWLYEDQGLEIDSGQLRVFPFPEDWISKRDHLSTREFLVQCRQAREASQANGLPPSDVSPIPSQPSPPPTEPPVTEELTQLWNDFQLSFQVTEMMTEPDYLSWLEWALLHCRRELSAAHNIQVHRPSRGLELDLRIGEIHEEQLIAVCNRGAAGGALDKQIRAAQDVADLQKRRCIVIRSSPFPGKPGSQTATTLGKLINAGGRRIEVGVADWRAMQAMKAFVEKYTPHADFDRWLKVDRPLSTLHSLAHIFVEFAQISAGPQPTTTGGNPPGKDMTPQPVPEPISPPTPPWILEKPMRLGSKMGYSTEDVPFGPAALTRHAAVLGGTGSGKTTLVLQIIEQLVARGVPAILVDRKGDLCGYADNDAWSRALLGTGGEVSERLRANMEAHLFTPGSPDGRELSISVLPKGMSEMSPTLRDDAARYGADSLAGMMNYNTRGADQTRRVVLMQAIKVLSQLVPEERRNLNELITLIHDQDASLINEIGVIDPKHLVKLAQDLQTLQLGNKDLFVSSGEQLDVQRLLGMGPHARDGKTRLSIISTKFLQSQDKVLFYIAQLLIELGRFASKNPSDKLQAVVMFDEADMYLPAVGKPATKEPMENALKRFRSAGIGIILATQNPGDFDYKCRDNIQTWCVGRVREENSLNKMKPMLKEAKVDVTAKLPTQATGEFHLLRAGSEPVAFKADMSLLRTSQLADTRILELARAQAGR